MKSEPKPRADASLPLNATPEHAELQAPAKRCPLDSRVLFGGGNELVIFHYGETYRLRETRQRKLILTK